MNVDTLLRRLRANPSFGPFVRHVEELPGADGSYCSFPDWLHPALSRACADRGIDRLYSHQFDALEIAHARRDLCISTSTASGKTLCYNLPVLDRAIRTDGAAKAIYLFPTKALAQDQVAELTDLITRVTAIEHGLDLRCFTYDGDTPPGVRRKLRERGNIVVTNPWMLHQGILPNHAKWVDLFRGLEFIVLDEVHTLSGVFGSHVANVLRRLVRIARYYGSNPIFIASSATIGNPREHLARLAGRPVEIIDRESAPRGEKTFLIYNPPLLNAVAGLRASALEEARKLADVVTSDEHQSIFFVRTRPQVEILVKYLKDSARAHGRDADRIRGYRGGYLPDLRRAIERDLRDGTVKTVVSTNALELGIDVGRLDVAVLVGYPGTVASAWQQAGRAGRRSQPSLAILIARSSPMDQYITQEPGYLFHGAREHATINPNNTIILANQLKCAAFELPFHRENPDFGAPDADVREILDYLAGDAQLLHLENDTYHWSSEAYPAQDVSLEGEDSDDVTIVDSETRKVLGLLARPASIVELYEGAIYGHQGETYQVERFDYDGRRAYIKPVVTDFYTEAQTDTDVRWLREDKRSPCAAARFEGNAVFDIVLGEVHVTTVATMFKKIRFYTRENVGAGEIHLPGEEMLTDAFGLVLAPDAAAAVALNDANRGGGLRGFASLMKQLAPLFIKCEPSDFGHSVELRSPHFGRPAITIFDRHRDGVGLSETLYHCIYDLLAAARAVLNRCDCKFGCPACIGPADEVGSRGKATARALSELLLGNRDAALAAIAGDAPAAREMAEY
ncbi:MAG: DEAD/DEAH box helicase [Planctomycetes bacterium]|nr:DEAD/DEAH box helicase [Planctomycetota bacterium]